MTFVGSANCGRHRYRGGSMPDERLIFKADLLRRYDLSGPRYTVVSNGAAIQT